MLLGSVSQHLVAHAPCPVVVVRAQPQRVTTPSETVHATAPVPTT
jgi:hypothetical protein